ncbi:MAG: CBS and ACT domain-containing protein [Nitrospirota bacterium]|nr:CBS and ACT domain-containing protein [Nitrospirota bacterium]
MFVSDWMTKRVFTISPDDSITDAVKLMREKCIKHIPVIKDEKLKGIISDRDIKEFTPSKATTLDVYELHYLLAKTKVKEVMKSKVVTTAPDVPVEEAAMIMYDEGIGCLPVMEQGRLEGIISDKDIYRALVDITGVRHGGHRVYLTIEDRPGSIKEVADIIRKYGFRMQSILTSYERVGEGYRKVVIRTKGKGDFKGMKKELQDSFKDAVLTCRNIVEDVAMMLNRKTK